VALLTNEWGFWGEQVYIVRVDNTKIARRAYTYEIELRPGMHVVEFGYGGPYHQSVDNAVLLLNAEAGHHYEARADWLDYERRSPDEIVIGGPGFWAPSIFDITTRRTVVPTQATPGSGSAPTPPPPGSG